MIKIGVITNPHSKLNRKNPSRPRRLAYILGEQGVFEMTESVDHLQQVAENFLDKNIDVLAINGGDGTISHTLSAFIKVYGDKPLPKVALLKGGTMNVTAVNLGIKGGPEELLSLLLEKTSLSEKLEVVSVPSIHVNHNYGFIYADGTSANILKEFYKKKTGSLGAVWLGVRIWASALFNTAFAKSLIKSSSVELISEDYSTAHNSLGVFASTIKKLPLGLPIFCHAGKGDSHNIHALSVLVEPQKLRWKFLQVIFSKTLGRSTVKESFICEHLKVRVAENFLYTIDGELYESDGKDVEIQRGPVIEFVAL